MYEREQIVRPQQRPVEQQPDAVPILPGGVQATLTVGSVDDPLEREADEVAAQVVRSLSGSASAPATLGADDEQVARSVGIGRISRASSAGPAADAGPEVGPEGGPASSEVSSRIRASAGRGSALPDGLRTSMEGAFGTDLSGVRIHRSSALAPRLGAEAFTAGSDIHFAPGRFQPSSSSGLHLLSHELTHVVQQSGGLARRDIRRTAADTAVTTDERAASTVPAEVSADRRSGVVRASFGSKVKGFFKGAKKKAKTVLGKADAQPDTETEDARYDALAHDKKMENQRKFRGSGPGENPDYSNTAVWGQDPDRFVVTLAVAQENPEWMNNVKALKSTALRELARSPKKLMKDLDAAQDVIVRQLLTEKGELDGKTEDEIARLVKDFTDGIHEVGHTWIRLSTYVGGTLKELYSYGMWPQLLFSPADNAEVGGYAGFVDPGPGEVRHPDLAHEDDDMKVYKDYEVSASSFDKALDLAIERYNSPPPYVLTGYNCTAFAREVLVSAGKSYPGKGLLPGFAYTPGDLYWSVMKEVKKGKKNAYTDDRHEDAVQKIADRQTAFAAAGKKSVVDEYEATGDKGIPLHYAPRKTVTLHKDAWLNFGETPNRLDKTVQLDADMDVTVVADRRFRNKWGVVPLEFGPSFWFVSESSYRAAKGAPRGATTSDDGLGGKGGGIIAWLTFQNDGLAMWDSDGVQANGTYRAKGMQVGATGRTKPMKGETYVEFVVGEVTAWMPAAWWNMYFDSDYPTGSTTPTTSDDQSPDIDEITDTVDDDFDELDDDLDDLDDSDTASVVPDVMDEEDKAIGMPMVIAVLENYNGFDPSTLYIVIEGGVDGIDMDLVREMLTGPGADDRAEQIAAALGMTVEEVKDLFRP